MTTSPFGSWPSPISPSMLAGSQISYWGIAAQGDDLIWGEFRPAEAGRIALVRHTASGPEEVASSFSARTLAHEYGGMSLAMDGGRIVAASVADQRLHRLDGDSPAPITPEPPAPPAALP